MSHNSPLNIFHRLPPEAIVKNVFTLKSDVWSYGITLWEMFSFGQQPWAELNFNQVQSVLGIFGAIFSPFEKSTCTFQKIFKVCLAKIDFKMNDMRDPGILFWKGLHVSGLNVYHAEKSPNIDIIDHYFNNFHNFPSTFE